MGSKDAEDDLLKGISRLVNPLNVENNINYEEIEKAMISSGDVTYEKTDPTESFNGELGELAKTLGIEFNTPVDNSSMMSPMPKYGGTPMQTASTPMRSQSTPMQTSTLMQTANTPTNLMSSPLPSESLGAPPPDLSMLGLPAGLFDSPKPPKDVEFSGFDRSDTIDHSSNHSSSRRRTDGESDFTRRTNEERRHAQVRNVMGSMGGDNSKFIDLEEAGKEDEKAIMLEEIDSLRASLEEEEARGISCIPNATQDDDYTTVENILRRLRLKNDRMRYTSLASEFILWGAQGVEHIFDGKRTYFNSKPDMSGWSREVQVKLRRMQHDTSTLVSGVMHDYNIGPGMRILLELVPNFFIFAKRKKNNTGRGNLYSNADIASHMSNIRDIDEM